MDADSIARQRALAQALALMEAESAARQEALTQALALIEAESTARQRAVTMALSLMEAESSARQQALIKALALMEKEGGACTSARQLALAPGAGDAIDGQQKPALLIGEEQAPVPTGGKTAVQGQPLPLLPAFEAYQVAGGQQVQQQQQQQTQLQQAPAAVEAAGSAEAQELRLQAQQQQQLQQQQMLLLLLQHMAPGGAQFAAGLPGSGSEQQAAAATSGSQALQAAPFASGAPMTDVGHPKPQVPEPPASLAAADFQSLFELGQELGRGAFGVTRLVRERRTGATYACKSISKHKLVDKEDREDIRREIQVMHHVAGHPSIARIHSSHEDRDAIHIVMELCTGGDLYTALLRRGHYSERDAAACFRAIVSAVAHCHSLGVMHRDLKPENMLLSDEGEGAATKATDFGLSVFFREGQPLNTMVGSPYYIAPEVLRPCRYSKEADMWSCGVILYILLSGRPPFMGTTERQIYSAVIHKALDLKEEPWPSISSAAKEVITKLLVREPSRRATAAEILRHEWVCEGGSAPNTPLEPEVLNRMRTFATMNNFKKQALKMIACHLSEDEIRGLRELFKSMDADASGAITVDEMREGLLAKGASIPEDELEMLMENADVNGDGTIDYEEFLAATMHLNKLEREEHLYYAFSQFDSDNSGFVSREELLQALGTMRLRDKLQNIEQIIEEVDKDKDGQIDYAEFCEMMRSNNQALANAAHSLKRGVMLSAPALESFESIKLH